MTEEQSQVYQASQLSLMWWKFKRHRVAVASGIFLAALYLMILVCEFLAPYNLHTRNMDFIYSPPQRVHFFSDGQFVGPFVYGRQMTLDMDTLEARATADDRSQVQPIRFFCRRRQLQILGVDRKQPSPGLPGRKTANCSCSAPTGLGVTCCRASSIGARISLTIGLVGIAFSFVLGIIIGGLAGYHGGVFDLIVQRVIEVLQSIPSIPLWMALAAIMPVTWSPILIYFGITAHPRAARLDRVWRAPCARNSSPCARKTMCSLRN